jgi:hypothetical protein
MAFRTPGRPIRVLIIVFSSLAALALYPEYSFYLVYQKTFS